MITLMMMIVISIIIILIYLKSRTLSYMMMTMTTTPLGRKLSSSNFAKAQAVLANLGDGNSVGRATKWTTITIHLQWVHVHMFSCTQLENEHNHEPNKMRQVEALSSFISSNTRLRLPCFSSEANPICLRTSARHVAFRLVLWEKNPAVSTHPALADSAPRSSARARHGTS